MALQGNFATAVSAVVDSLESAELANISEAIFQESFLVGDFANAHTLITNRRTGNVQPIVLAHDKYGSFAVGDQKACDLNTEDLTPNYSTKEWTLSEYNGRYEICMRSFDEDFLIFWNMYRQRLEDPTQEPDAQVFLDYIVNIIEENILGAQWRVGYWGDTSATTNDYINGNDGWFVQAAAGSGSKHEITVTGTEPTGEEIYDAMAEAYEASVSELWFANTDVVFKTTYKVASKLVSWLNKMQDTSQYDCSCFDADGITAARRFNVEGLTMFGIKVEAHREVDLSMTAAAQTDPYKILLTRKSNLLIGVNTQDKMEAFDMFYDKKDRKIYIDAMIHLGLMIPLDDYAYITVAEEE